MNDLIDFDFNFSMRSHFNQFFSVFGNVVKHGPACLKYYIPYHLRDCAGFKFNFDSYLLLVGNFIVLFTFEPQSVHDHGIQANHQCQRESSCG